MSATGLPILSVCRHSTKSLEDPHSRFYPPEDRVLVVKEWCRSKSEEKLRTCSFLDGTRWNGEDVHTVGVGTRVSHCQDSCTSKPQFWMKLVFAMTDCECQ
jgi:hypothetical protein